MKMAAEAGRRIQHGECCQPDGAAIALRDRDLASSAAEDGLLDMPRDRLPRRRPLARVVDFDGMKQGHQRLLVGRAGNSHLNGHRPPGSRG